LRLVQVLRLRLVQVLRSRLELGWQSRWGLQLELESRLVQVLRWPWESRLVQVLRSRLVQVLQLLSLWRWVLQLLSLWRWVLQLRLASLWVLRWVLVLVWDLRRVLALALLMAQGLTSRGAQAVASLSRLESGRGSRLVVVLSMRWVLGLPSPWVQL